MKLKLSKEYREKLEQHFGKDIIFKENRIISIMSYKIDTPEKIVIPSRMYPLEGEGDIRIFTIYNTEKLDDDIIRTIYDNTQFKTGSCYSNSERLLENLTNSGIVDVEPYVGWFYNCTDDRPVHHCALVYKEKYMLDMSSDSDVEELYSWHANFQDEIRERLAERYVNRMKNMKASERSCFGDMMPQSLFIARKLQPKEGANFFFQKFREWYPNHPSYKNTGSDGATKTQRMIKDRL